MRDLLVLGWPKVLVEWKVAMLELGLRRFIGLCLCGSIEGGRDLSCSQPAWRKMGISPELARVASPPKLPEGDGLGGLRVSSAWRAVQF